MKTTSKFKHLLLVTALALCPLLVSEKAFAQTNTATGTLLQTGTGLSSFVGTAGGTFSLDLNLVNVSFPNNGLTYFFQVSPAGSGFFSVTGRNIGASLFTDLITPDATAFTAANGLLDPINNNDLGAVTAVIDPPQPPGSYFVATLTFSISGLVPAGTYNIFLDPRAIVVDRTGGNFNDATLTTNMVTITIVPEPATTGLAVLGGIVLLGFVWKARRVMA